MNTKFRFDKKTGTMVADRETQMKSSGLSHKDEVIKAKITDKAPIATFKENNKIETKPTNTPANNEVVKMARVNTITPVQLVNEKGLPESYLDSITTGVVMFRERDDYDICQITDEKTGKILAVIAGYALQINFNMAELKTMERIEECLQGIVKLFRHKLMTQNLGRLNEDEDKAD